MYERIIKLLGEDNFTKIKNTKILLVGIGGVGSFVYESLIRSGFQNITIIDNDRVDVTNLNRQLISNLNVINQNKVDVALKHAKEINKNIEITPLYEFLNSDNINDLNNDYDYIIDACDTLNTKLALIEYASAHNIKIISSMGMANRVNAESIVITTLGKTYNDPLAQKLRKLVKKKNIDLNIPVVWSKELPIKRECVNSIITPPGVAGLLITNYIINDLIFID